MKKTWKRFAMAGSALVLVLALSMFIHREPRIDYLVSRPGRIGHQQLAIEREVIQAELTHYGTKLIPSLRSELRRGQWHRSSLVRGVLRYCPKQVAEAIVRADAQDDQRKTKAALLLGRLGSKAQIAVPDLQAMAASGGYTAYPAEVALAMIQPTSATVRSNALAALASASQPRRAYFALHADELWPSQPDIVEGCLNDPDATVRAHALTALCS